MKRRITLKLFLILLLTVSLVVVAMLLMTRWSFQRGFTDYLNQLDEAQVGEVVERLQDYYQEAGGWQQLHQRPKLWRKLTHSSDTEDETPEPIHQHQTPTRPDRFNSPIQSERPIEFERPPRPPRFRPAEPLDIGPRLSLFDAEKRQINGHPVAFDQLRSYPLQSDTAIIGWLGVKPIEAPSNLRDIQFAQSQTSNLYMIGALIIVVAALVSLLLAGHLLVPIRALAKGARSLANGEFDTQVPVNSEDELGQLSIDFNHLANTLAANEKARQRWITDISHELRTPVAVIQGELEALQDGVRVFTDDVVNSLHHEIVRLGRLINDLHQLSLSDLGSLSYKYENLNLISVIENVLEHKDTDIKQKHIDVKFNSSQPNVIVNGDYNRLQQLFYNLSNNSLSYTKENGSITIDISISHTNVIINWCDSEPGVNDEDLNKLFERLYRADASRNRNTGGSGLGLSVCKNIVEAHQGSINASHAELGGVCFCIKLPLAS